MTILRGQLRRALIQANRVQYAPRLTKVMVDDVVVDRFVHNPRNPLQAVTKAPRRSTSKYSPHQGEQECARRVRQMVLA